MDQVSLEYFISAAYHLNFTKAAEDCHVVQATISRQIAALEAEIGTPLFFREKYGVSLTPAGQRLFATAHSLLEQYNEILFDCRKAGQDQLPKLRIGTGPYEAILLREVLKELQARYGHRMEINLMGYTYKILSSRFRNESVHIGFCSERCGTSSGLLEFLPLYKENWKVIAAEDSPFWDLSPEQQALLEDQTIITSYENEFEEVRPYCRKHGLRVRGFAETNFLNTQMSMVRAGIGVAIVPGYLEGSLARGVRMADVLQEPQAPVLGIAYDKRTQNPGVQLCRDLCLEYFPALANHIE